ncbi:MAG: C10 family peptidase [Chitinophagaceae bacterium]
MKSLFSNPILSTLTLRDTNNYPMVHVINYKDSGFALISGNKNSFPVLGYSEHGIFNIDSLPPGFSCWLSDKLYQTEFSRKNITNRTILYNALWNEYESSLSGSDDSVNEDDTEDHDGHSFDVPESDGGFGNATTTTVLKRKYPASNFIETAMWNQQGGANNDGYRFNSFTPLIDGKQTLVGCVPLAGGIAMRYWKWPSSFNWDDMPIDNTASYYTAMLLGPSNLGNLPNIEYGLASGNGTLADVSELRNVLVNRYNYSSDAVYEDINNEDIMSDLSKNYIVIMNGWKVRIHPTLFRHTSYQDGHCWIVDAGEEFKTYIGDATPFLTYTYHMNWGWGGALNGWFNMDSDYGNVSIANNISIPI